MNMLVRPPLLTVDEFDEMPAMEGYELIDGKPREKSMGFESSFVQRRIGTLLGEHVDRLKLGWVADAEGGYACFPHRPRLVRKPDVSFVRAGRFPGDRPPRGNARLVPDLVVEVVSLHDLVEEHEAKIADYRSVRVPVIWSVIPKTRTAYVFRADGQITWHTADDELSADPAIPGFRIRLADVLPPPESPDEEPAPEPTAD